MRQTPLTLWLATAKPGDTFIKTGFCDSSMALAARRAGCKIETARAIAVNGTRAFKITIGTMRGRVA